MDKRIFKVGDKVYDISFGWGEINYIYGDGKIIVNFKNLKKSISIIYEADGKIGGGIKQPVLSFTEYTLQGFSQEKPIDYAEYEGKWGKFWNDEDSLNKTIEISMLEEVEYEKFDKVKFAPISTGTFYDNFTPLSDKQLKMLGLK